jgi:hypothetical protein
MRRSNMVDLRGSKGFGVPRHVFCKLWSCQLAHENTWHPYHSFVRLKADLTLCMRMCSGLYLTKSGETCTLVEGRSIMSYMSCISRSKYSNLSGALDPSKGRSVRGTAVSHAGTICISYASHNQGEPRGHKHPFVSGCCTKISVV